MGGQPHLALSLSTVTASYWVQLLCSFLIDCRFTSRHMHLFIQGFTLKKLYHITVTRVSESVAPHPIQASNVNPASVFSLSDAALTLLQHLPLDDLFSMFYHPPRTISICHVQPQIMILTHHNVLSSLTLRHS